LEPDGEATAAGVGQIYIDDLRESFAIRLSDVAPTDYEGEYCSAHRSRVLIAKRQIDIARDGARMPSHGATGK
jgi:argininosuccinate synthase